ncbi:MAG: TonB-dependent receptor [Saprospiraceae bacterium]|nr:TonB-dependent receptor [Saprospiraceae bacterium]
MRPHSLKLWKCLLVGICALAGDLFGQTRITGVVTSSVNEEPLIAATIEINSKGTYSDLQGRFAFLCDTGVAYIVVRYLGYETFADTIVLQVDSLNLSINLHPLANPLAEVTVSTGRYEQVLGETTVSVETLDAALIEQSNTTSIDDVLDKVPGMAIIDGQANIRGGSGFSYGAGSRVLMLVDDVPAYQADSGFPNWDDYPIENIASLEVVKGASSVLYGSAALNGTINLRTAYVVEKPKTKVFTFYRSYFRPRDKIKKWWDDAPFEYGVGLSDARRLGKVDIVNGFYYLDRQSFQRDNYNQYGRIYTKVRYKINQQVEVGVGGMVNTGKNQSFFFWKNAQEGAYQGEPSNFSKTNYLRFSIDPYLKIINPRGDRHEVKGRIFSVRNRSIADRSNNSQLYYGEYQYLRPLPSLDATITTGIVGIHTGVNADLYGDTSFMSNNLAAFFQVEKRFLDKLTLQGGVRYERNTVAGPRLVNGMRNGDGTSSEARPVLRFGATYKLSEYSYLRASWGEGYRFPTIAEKYISTTFGSTLISPNLDLQSETGWSSEIGIRQGFKISKFTGLLDVAAYWSEYFDMMEFIFTGLIEGFQSQNVGDTRIRGFDISLNGSGHIIQMPVVLLAGYTYIDPTFQNFTKNDSLSSTSSQNILKYRSRHLWKLDAQFGGNKLQMGLSVQHTSNVEAIDAIFELFIPGLQKFRQQHRGNTTTDVRLIYGITEKLKATLLMRNVLNEEYSVRPGILAAPRNLSLRLDCSL